MNKYKTYDDSRPGNDCYIDCIWHWLPGPRLAVRTMYISGYTFGWETEAFASPHGDMPNEVMGWFK